MKKSWKPLALGMLVLASPLGSCRCGTEQATGSLTGTLCRTADGRPARLAIEAQGVDTTDVQRATSDAAGQFNIASLTPGTYRAIITSPTDTTQPRRTFEGITITSGQETIFRDPDCGVVVSPASTGTLRGRVCDAAAGQWAGYADVSVAIPNGTVLHATADATGEFTLASVPSGARTVRIQQGSYDRSFSVIVTAGQETWVVTADQCVGLGAAVGGVHGLACAPDGGPLSGARVYVQVGTTRFTDTVDSQGSFTITGLPPGPQVVHVLTLSSDQALPVTVVANQLAEVMSPDCPVACQGPQCSPPIDGGVVIIDDPTTGVDAGTVTFQPDGGCITYKQTVCECMPGDARGCYSGPAGTQDVGVCRAGTQECADGTWGGCVGEVVPQFEVCDAVDDNCNGQVDEGLACGVCSDGEWQACYTGAPATQGVGQCHDGLQQCNGGAWGWCLGQGFPSSEVCNGQDDNCNGQVDEGLNCQCHLGDTLPCYSGPAGTQGVGICRAGVQRCDNSGQFGPCTGQVFPSAEACDDADNNCDGRVDENCPECSGDALVYANTSSELYTVDAITLAVHRRGPFVWPGDGHSHQMTDIAVTRGGQIWGVTFDALYKVNRYSVECTLVAALSGSSTFNALSLLPSSGGTERLVAATNEGTYFEINQSNGAATYLGSYGSGAGSAGDIVSIAGAATYATVNSSGEHLALLDDQSGAATLVGVTGETATWGLGYWGGRLFGFLEEGAVVLIDPGTGHATPMASTPNQHWWGAGVTTCAPTQ